MSAAKQLLDTVKGAALKEETIPSDLLSLTAVATIEDTDVVVLDRNPDGIFKSTFLEILGYIRSKAHTWSQKQTFELGISNKHQFTQIITPVAANNEINCVVSNSFSKTVTGATTFTFLAPGTSASTCYAFLLDIDHVSGSIFWPANTYWSSPPPELTSGRKHQFVFYTNNNGASWRASVLPNYTA